jgi:hypothetical protein
MLPESVMRTLLLLSAVGTLLAFMTLSILIYTEQMQHP